MIVTPTTNGSLIGITGASGFIGSRLVRTLDEAGIAYRALKGDLFDPAAVESFFSDGAVTQVVHLVGTFNPPFANLVRLNVEALQSMLEIGRRYGLKKVVLSSTGAVYGNPIISESFESDPLNPNTLYGLTKCFAESCLRFYADTYGLQYVILRFPNVYGPQGGKGVINLFMKSIQETGTVTVNGDGTQSRNFLHIDDAARALLSAIRYPKLGIFNASNSKKVSVNDLIALLKRKYTFTVRHESANNNQKHLLLNTEKARTELHFTAEIHDIQI
jgi:UDP-glucose 4-epimerase